MEKEHKLQLTVSVDGLRSNLAHDYNELVRTLRNLVDEENIQDGSIYGDAFDEIEEKLGELRQSVGLLLCIQSGDGEINALKDELYRLESATITKEEEDE